MPDKISVGVAKEILEEEATFDWHLSYCELAAGECKHCLYLEFEHPEERLDRAFQVAVARERLQGLSECEIDEQLEEEAREAPEPEPELGL